MKNIRTVVLGAAALMCLAGGAQAFTHHPSTPAERAQTKALNEEQLKLAQQENASLAMNGTATDASANMADNSAPAAAPTSPIQHTDGDTPMMRPPGSGPSGP
jgi:hypothetical protein